MDRFTELMQDLGLHVAGVLNPNVATTPPPEQGGLPTPPGVPSTGGMAPWQGRPAIDYTTLNQPPAPPAAPSQPWAPQGVPFPNTQSGQPALAPTPMPAYDPTGASPPAQPRVAGAQVPSATLQMPPPMVSGYDPTGPSAALQMPIDLGLMQPDPGISTQQMSGYPPQVGPEPSRQGEYGPAGTRGTTGSRGAPGPAANGAPSSAGPAPSVSGTGPAAPPSSPQAKVQDALTPKGDRFGITPRTYQLMGVIGATLMMGARPGESPMAAMGRAVGAGMMYDNFARVSDQEAASNERVLAMKEKQIGLEGQKVGQSGRLTEARITQIKADIESDKVKLGLATSREERDAILDRIKTQSALIGLAFQPGMLQADLDTKQAGLGTVQDKHRKLIGEIFEKNKAIDGGLNLDAAATQYRAMGIGKPLSPADAASAKRALDAARTKGAQEYARVRQEIIVRSMQNGWQLPPL